MLPQLALCAFLLTNVTPSDGPQAMATHAETRHDKAFWRMIIIRAFVEGLTRCQNPCSFTRRQPEDARSEFVLRAESARIRNGSRRVVRFCPEPAFSR